eukprot:Seg2197.11 transcript_id=Seg2197.11/GoldUCD/mRNA.D3Y31 product="hypothetical protein" protein_id=Seg2197.11/GoldUCD/D3Y31
MIDVLQPAVTLMVKSQALAIPPWKIISWFPRLIALLSKIEDEIQQLKLGEVLIPDKKVVPTLAQHWEELTQEESEDCTFQGIEVYPGWMVVDERTEQGEATTTDGRRQKKKNMITWKARSPDDCLDDLQQLSQQLRITPVLTTYQLTA